MKKSIEVALNEAISNRTRKVRITFKEDGKPGLYGLMSMANAQLITMLPHERMIAITVVTSGNWEQGVNRTFTIELKVNFRPQMFVAVMTPYLEKIAYAKPKQT